MMMTKQRKAKNKAVKRWKRPAPARKRKTAVKRRPAKKSTRKAKPKRRQAKIKLPPRSSWDSAPRPMTPPGPAVSPIAPRASPFPSSVPGDFPPPCSSKND
jgi:hypothetical protein